MSKLGLIISREYLTRVRKRSFLLTTILTPIGFGLFFVAVIFIMGSGSESLNILVHDEAGLFAESTLPPSGDLDFQFNKTSKGIKELQKSYLDDGFNGILHIKPYKDIKRLGGMSPDYYSGSTLGLQTKGKIESLIEKQVRKLKLKSFDIDETKLDLVENTNVSVGYHELDSEGVEIESKGTKGRVELATAIGFGTGFLIYIVIFIYGTMVMRSVMEEKMNRIVEVVISSVKPFELMMGKIIGVAAVGLTQFAIWIVLVPAMYLGLGFLFSGKLMQMQEAGQAGTGSVDAAEMEIQIFNVMSALGDINIPKIVILFLVFFILGYVLYASLFAAVGSAVGDDMGESQALTLPISIPVILALYISIAVINNPNGSMAMWASLVPFFSPIVMPALLAFDPPWWQILLSIAILIVTCIGIVWLAGRIYRVGILMYGKKVTFRELAKWIFYKD